MNDNETRVEPDVFAVFGVAGKHCRDNWLVWREGKAPGFVMEIASPSACRRDISVKRDAYAEMGVAECWRCDATGRLFAPPLAAERLTGGQYQPMPLETDGDGVLRGHSGVLDLESA